MSELGEKKSGVRYEFKTTLTGTEEYLNISITFSKTGISFFFFFFQSISRSSFLSVSYNVQLYFKFSHIFHSRFYKLERKVFNSEGFQFSIKPGESFEVPRRWEFCILDYQSELIKKPKSFDDYRNVNWADLFFPIVWSGVFFRRGGSFLYNEEDHNPKR